tara:strand:- start:69 stop:455 length:387 start_codon:yes stop_codon:yes gene_type:complete
MSNVTNKQLLEISASLDFLSQQNTQAWYQIGRNLKKIKPFVEELNEAKVSIIEKFVKKDKEGAWVFLDENKTMWDLGDKQAEADKLWADTQEQKIKIDFFTFKFDALGDIKLNADSITPLIDTVILGE